MTIWSAALVFVAVFSIHEVIIDRFPVVFALAPPWMFLFGYSWMFYGFGKQADAVERTLLDLLDGNVRGECDANTQQ